MQTLRHAVLHSSMCITAGLGVQVWLKRINMGSVAPPEILLQLLQGT